MREPSLAEADTLIVSASIRFQRIRVYNTADTSGAEQPEKHDTNIIDGWLTAAECER